MSNRRATDLILILALFCGSSCSSSKEELKELNTNLEVKGQTPDSRIGLDEEGQAIVQKETSASSKLATLQHVNENLKLDLKQVFFLLKECRETLALSAHGGSGEYPELTDFQSLEARYEKTAELGMAKGELKVVETSNLKERIEAEEGFKKELESFIRTVKKEGEKCNFQLKERESIQIED